MSMEYFDPYGLSVPPSALPPKGGFNAAQDSATAQAGMKALLLKLLPALAPRSNPSATVPAAPLPSQAPVAPAATSVAPAAPTGAAIPSLGQSAFTGSGPPVATPGPLPGQGFGGGPQPFPSQPASAPNGILAGGLPFSSPSSSGPSGAPQATSGQSLIQKFIAALSNSKTAQGASPAQLAGTPFGVTGSMFGS